MNKKYYIKNIKNGTKRTRERERARKKKQKQKTNKQLSCKFIKQKNNYNIMSVDQH